MKAIMTALENRIGYAFKDESLLFRALSHTSFAHEQSDHGRQIDSNERLEFLGDSVVSLIVTDYLYKQYSQISEGDMTDLRKFSVDTEALSGYARKIDLGSALFLGKGEENSGGREKNKLLENTFEALIAAMYLDAGIGRTAEFLLPFVKERVREFFTLDTIDPKTALQQIVQLEPEEQLEYVLVEESGPAHNKLFTVEARLNSNVIGKGTAHSKREAEKLAAAEALHYFDN